ncbi:hypothetical protein [Paenibacillus pinisoli]|uniref:hypothetical protein n=1 Tax=Paenibacillus pinisoli TaxID=1276110 RepID=UPI001401CC06|nr:hypothetical protein [Paenibacillus pinisoli]
MSDVTEMILDGILCGSCGAYIDDGDEPGHPRNALIARNKKGPLAGGPSKQMLLQ